MTSHGNTKHGQCSGGKNTPAYDCWHNMLKRCNDPSNKAYKFYGAKGVTVCPEWHDFEVFRTWYESNYPTDGEKYQLDKDVKDIVIKTYSPETCKFISQKENVVKAQAKTWVFLTPEGDEIHVYNLREFCRHHGLSQSNMCNVHSGKRAHHKQWRKFNETNECT